jgi:hypothetical protein
MPAGGAWQVPLVHSSEPRQLGPSSVHAPPAATFAWQVPAHVELGAHSVDDSHAAPSASAPTHVLVASQ